ncbi:unnamed protein product [Schistosoma mattheei]|uniref:Peptidase aspartic putative domain-containing protein n=1 Tax=Schistosoma mattheei TaxID=31246 RepID=A0AA85BIE0_9TREM|nr:unnamed protein product [Schistosoma mattheei]CAH8498889.1 unnamed protein product [Schistosoma mattheei]
MPNNRRRKLSPRLVDVKRDEQKDGSPQSRQVPSDASMCHGSYSNRDDCNYSESSCDIMANGIENLNLDLKQAKGVRPTAFFIGPELPKVELSYFDGQPRGYWKFLREFETYVESRVKDDGQRLLYLMHYCKGKAKTAIEGCVMLEASFGYKKAKEILKRLFGQAHVIARETLEDLFKTTNVDYSDPEQLTNLAIRMENCSMVLKQMKYTADLNSLITLERIVGLLPQVMQAQWADWVDELTEDNREPTFDELTQFIASRARVANSRFGRLANRPRKGHNLKTNCHLQLEQANNSKEKAKCSVCSLDHAIYKCPNFLALTVQERWSHAKVNGICFVCLRQGHKVSECKLAKRCNVEGCERKHHSLLHSESEKSGTSSCCGYTKSLISQVCLGMIPVRLKSRKAEIVGYALLDNGSDVTLIRSNCLRSLGLSEDEASVVVETVGGNRTMKVTSAPFEVYSLDQSEHVTIEGALVVASIPGHKPTKSAMNNLVKWPHLSDVPIDSLDSEEVLLLIGCDVPEAHWVLDQRLGGRKNPYAVKTLLGWTVFGPASYSEHRKRVVNHTSKLQTLENEIRKLYDVEFSDDNSKDKSVSIENKAAIRIVEGGTRFENGHFAVPVPWKVNSNMKGRNYEVANNRLQSVKRRLSKDDLLYIKYTTGIESNFIQGYAEILEIQLRPSYHPRWYLPHHAVLNPKKPANFALNKTAQIFSDGYVVDDVKNNFYVDDCLISIPTCNQAKSFVKHISELLCRGSIQKVTYLEYWFECPTLLHGEFYITITDCPEHTPDAIELRKTAVGNLSSIKYNMLPILSYYSEWLKLIRAVTWFRRFIEFLMVHRAPSCKGSVHLGCLKVDIAKCKNLLMVQREVYGKLFSGFRNSSKVVRYDLKGLSPIMLDGLLCVTGRLSYSESLNAFKHPVILRSRHLVTEMIIRHYHKEPGHIGRSLEKGYRYVFTCLQTWAVHIELMCSLIADSLRFIGRRRKPPEIYSDSASSFVGTVSELRRVVQQSNQQKINIELSARPSSNSMAGVWGRVIRSIPRLLLLITREQMKQVSLKLRVSLFCY